jgi:hypothetical protein
MGVKIAISVAMGYWLDGPGSIPGSVRFFSFSQCLDWVWGPPSLLSNGYWVLFPQEIKQQGHEADHSPPSSDEVKKVGLYLHSLMSS